MKRRLLVILGAGSSVECGMPSVAEIDVSMRAWSAELARLHRTPDYFALVWDAFAKHLEQGQHAERSKPDCEKALSELIALMHWVRPPPVGSALRGLVANGEVPGAIAFPNLEKYGPSITLKMHASNLLAQLARELRGRCASLTMNDPRIAQWRQLLEALRGEFDVAIYNLNYDDIARRAWPEAFTGLGPTAGLTPRASIGARGMG